MATWPCYFQQVRGEGTWCGRGSSFCLRTRWDLQWWQNKRAKQHFFVILKSLIGWLWMYICNWVLLYFITAVSFPLFYPSLWAQILLPSPATPTAPPPGLLIWLTVQWLMLRLANLLPFQTLTTGHFFQKWKQPFRYVYLLQRIALSLPLPPQALLKLPPHLSQSEEVLKFFETTLEDLNPPTEWVTITACLRNHKICPWNNRC